MKSRGMAVTVLAAMLVASAAFAQSHESPDPAGDDHGALAFGDALDSPDFDMEWLAAGDAGGPGSMHMMRDQAHPGMGRMRMRGPMGRMGMGRGMFAEELKLTDAQRTRMAEIRDRQARKGIQARADLQIAALDLHKLMAADSPSKTSLDAQVDRIARLRADMQKSRIASMLEMRSLLTADQQARLRELRRDRGPERIRIRERIRERTERDDSD